MELSYWRSKWQNEQIGFHMESGYPGLQEHWNSIEIEDTSIVLVPLCGKSLDLIWLAEHCERVIGVEISELAVDQFLNENSLDAHKSSFASFTIYRTSNLEIWNGDFFKLPKHKLPQFNLIYDKASIVALPPKLRKKYAEKILDLVSDKTKILLHHFNYRQNEMPGPPFSVTLNEVKELYGEYFHLCILEEKELNIDYFKNFQKRGLYSYFIEILSLLLPKEQ